MKKHLESLEQRTNDTIKRNNKHETLINDHGTKIDDNRITIQNNANRISSNTDKIDVSGNMQTLLLTLFSFLGYILSILISINSFKNFLAD